MGLYTCRHVWLDGLDCMAKRRELWKVPVWMLSIGNAIGQAATLWFPCYYLFFEMPVKGFIGLASYLSWAPLPLHMLCLALALATLVASGYMYHVSLMDFFSGKNEETKELNPEPPKGLMKLLVHPSDRSSALHFNKIIVKQFLNHLSN